MSLFDRFTQRLLALVGLDFEFSMDVLRDPFHEISSDVVLGSRPTPEHVDALRALGVTHVVSCLPDGEQDTVAFLGEHFTTLYLPLRDGILEDIGSHLPPFFDFVASAEKGRALVHCEVGVSRSATLAIAHVMKTRRLRFYEAYREVRRRRPQVLPNVGFATQLQRYERTLFEPRKEGYPSLTRYLKEVCNVPVEIEVLQSMLDAHDEDALAAIRGIFGEEVPRVIQGVRV